MQELIIAETIDEQSILCQVTNRKQIGVDCELSRTKMILFFYVFVRLFESRLLFDHLNKSDFVPNCATLATTEFNLDSF